MMPIPAVVSVVGCGNENLIINHILFLPFFLIMIMIISQSLSFVIVVVFFTLEVKPIAH